LNIQVYKFTIEEIEKLNNEYDELDKQKKQLEETPVKNIWMSELNELEIAYKKWFAIEEGIFNDLSQGKSNAKGKKTQKKKIN